MIVWEHLALFFSALASAKYGLIDRRAPLTTIPASMVFFAAFSISSFYIEVGTGNGIETTSSRGMFVLGLGGTLFMMAMLVLEALDKLPDTEIENVLGSHLRRTETNNQRDTSPRNGD